MTVDNAGSDTADCDNDGSKNNVDVDDDNDGLIEIRFLEDLDAIRNDLNGDGAESTGIGNMGAPDEATANCETRTGGTEAEPTFLCGYELARNLDFSVADSYAAPAVDANWYTATLCDGATDTTNLGWTPIGGQFTAMFDGNDNTITNLRICRNDVTSVGLFGQIGAGGTVRDLVLIDATVEYTGSIEEASTGLLAGQSNGAIVAVGASGSASSVTGGSDSFNNVGGLVGLNEGTIIASYATIATVNGGTGSLSIVGGLVGWNRTSSSVIIASYASGNVDDSSIPGSINVGGLVGRNNGTITASYATATANGTSGGSDNVGGLVGGNQFRIIASYATGTANGGDGDGDSVGGLIGNGSGSGSVIMASYADGVANGGAGSGDSVGRLIGANVGSTPTASYGFSDPTMGTVNTAGTPPTIASTALTLNTLTALNSDGDAAATANDWSGSVWDFGTITERPVLRWVTKSDFTCDATLLPTGQTCGGIIPGQETR